MNREEKKQYKEIEEQILKLRDPKNAAFLSALLPETDKERVLGIRSPVLRKYAASLKKEGKDALFLSVLPHRYLDEDQIHAFLISSMREFEPCMKELERFLPFADNWAVTDALRPAVIRKNREAALEHIDRWMESDHPFTVRTAVGLLMAYYLDEGFDRKQMEKIAGLNTDHYYVHMAVAWYMATALAKQPEEAMRILESHAMSAKTHNKTIQKAVESYRITDEMKQLLRTMKRREH